MSKKEKLCRRNRLCCEAQTRFDEDAQPQLQLLKGVLDKEGLL